MEEVSAIALLTDFGAGGPYLGQMELRLAALVPDVPVIRLMSDAPAFSPELTAYLLPALTRDIPKQTLYLCVVDPGVGGERAALAVAADGNWFVGPDNGLLALVARRALECRVLRVEWGPEQMSDSFHGRDLFAPVAAMVATGAGFEATAIRVDDLVGCGWPDDLARIIYADHYGNLITGLRAEWMDRGTAIQVGGRTLRFARTFCEVPVGAAFWYENAFGLVELAVNRGRADRLLGLTLGDAVTPLA
jgi:S-adenosylmethionine hydrolase